jgi:hypothetical protein
MRRQKNTIIGFAWFDEMQWHLLTRIVPDRSELDATFEEWERAALRAQAKIEAQGNVVERVPIDVGALYAWCLERDKPVNSAARAEYVTTLLRQKYARP